MGYEILPSHFFLQQLPDIDKKGRKIIENKIKLLKINPFRYKRIHGYNLFLFRIRFEDNKTEKRLIYLVDKPYVKLLCILDRRKEYNDLKKYLKKLGYY